MNDKIEFRFCTRTLSEGHRVFYDDGDKTLSSYTEEFEPVEEIAQTADDAERSAVVFEKDGKIYLAAFALRRNALDRIGRQIRFSFCRIFRKSEAERAMNAFTRISEEWTETEKKVDSLIKEIPVIRPAVIKENFKGREEPGEDVKFNSKEFLDWLDEKPAEYDLPKAGTMLKYFDGAGVKTIPLGKYSEEDEDDEPGESHTYRLVMLILMAGLLIVGSVIGYSMWGKKSPQSLGQNLKPSGVNSNQQENSSESSQDATTKETTNGRHNSGVEENTKDAPVNTVIHDSSPDMAGSGDLQLREVQGIRRTDSGNTQPQATTPAQETRKGDETIGR